MHTYIYIYMHTYIYTCRNNEMDTRIMLLTILICGPDMCVSVKFLRHFFIFSFYLDCSIRAGEQTLVFIENV